eukprot:SAG11_NODE_106_length_16423_cov_51.220840_11_plen_178_part_00
MSTPQTRSKIGVKQRSTRKSTPGETVPVPAFAAGADRPAFRPIKEEPIDFTDLSDLTIDSDDDIDITFGDHQLVLVAPSKSRSAAPSTTGMKTDDTRTPAAAPLHIGWLNKALYLDGHKSEDPNEKAMDDSPQHSPTKRHANLMVAPDPALLTLWHQQSGVRGMLELQKTRHWAHKI